MFADNIKQNGLLVLEDSVDSSIFNNQKYSIIKYSSTKNSECRAENIQVKNGKMNFDICLNDDRIKGFELCLAGTDNISNTIAAVLVAYKIGINNTNILEGIQTFLGIERRFDVQVRTEKLIYIDDYAHHPKEISETLNAAIQMFPQKNITVVFQPRLYSRTKDFADEFAESLSVANQLVLLDIYGAREKRIPDVNSEMLLKKCTNPKKEVCSKSDLVSVLKYKKIEMLLTLGAGDISTEVHKITTMIKE